MTQISYSILIVILSLAEKYKEILGVSSFFQNTFKLKAATFINLQHHQHR